MEFGDNVGAVRVWCKMTGAMPTWTRLYHGDGGAPARKAAQPQMTPPPQMSVPASAIDGADVLSSLSCSVTSCRPTAPPERLFSSLGSFEKAPLRWRKRRVPREELLQKIVTRDEGTIKYIPDATSELGITPRAMLFGTDSHKKAFVDVDPRMLGSSPKLKPGSAGSASFEDADDGSRPPSPPPDKFCKHKVTMTRLGFADFDFGRFNSTRFAGLEGNLPNAYANSALQLLYFIPRIRVLALGYLSERKGCLATELGFLFHMLDQAKRVPSKFKSCQARNFLRTLRLSPDAQALGLLEPSKLELPRRAGAFLRFLLEEISNSTERLAGTIEGLFATRFLEKDKFGGGSPSNERVSRSVVLDLAYPAPDNDTAFVRLSFAKLLRRTLMQSAQIPRVYSKALKQYKPATQIKRAMGMPPVLVINCAQEDTSFLLHWRGQRKESGAASGKEGIVDEYDYLPEKVYVRIGDEGDVSVTRAKPAGGRVGRRVRAPRNHLARAQIRKALLAAAT